MNTYKFSVLISVYKKECPSNLEACLNSILEQSVIPEEIVIVKDGELTPELERTIQEYTDAAPKMYKIVPLETNLGLGLALAEGIKECNHELIARMDSDDIAVKQRFEWQLEEFKQDPELDICGGFIQEFKEDEYNVVATRKVPLGDLEIKKYQKKRDAFNHVSVMYKKSKVLAAGNYQHALLMEDSLLWTNMIMSGVKCKNIDKVLVLVRVGSEMFKRRGGWEYFLKYRSGRRQILKTGYISLTDYYVSLGVQLLVSMIPNSFREYIYYRLLRN